MNDPGRKVPAQAVGSQQVTAGRWGEAGGKVGLAIGIGDRCIEPPAFPRQGLLPCPATPLGALEQAARQRQFPQGRELPAVGAQNQRAVVGQQRGSQGHRQQKRQPQAREMPALELPHAPSAGRRRRGSAIR